MAKVVLISCVSAKRESRSKAADLYTSPLFKKNLIYAKSLKPDRIFILSAKHHLLNLNDEIEPYDLTLNNFKAKELKLWAEKALHQLSQVSNLSTDQFIFLAGEKYRKYLITHISNYDVPMQGLGIGKQLQFLTNKIESQMHLVDELHKLFNSTKRLRKHRVTYLDWRILPDPIHAGQVVFGSSLIPSSTNVGSWSITPVPLHFGHAIVSCPLSNPN